MVGRQAARELPADDAGASSIEYALLVVSIAAVIVTIVTVIGVRTGGLYVVDF